MDIDETGMLLEISRIRSFEHMPYGTVSGGVLDGMAVKKWWYGRKIPNSRSGIRDVLEGLGIPDAMPLVLGSMGMSLSNHYWIRPTDSDISWEDVNLFDNPFSDDLGDILFGMMDDGCCMGTEPDVTGWYNRRSPEEEMACDG